MGEEVIHLWVPLYTNAEQGLDSLLTYNLTLSRPHSLILQNNAINLKNNIFKATH
jgi:hypothetical protein